jgi:hypothetical protein
VDWSRLDPPLAQPLRGARRAAQSELDAARGIPERDGVSDLRRAHRRQRRSRLRGAANRRRGGHLPRRSPDRRDRPGSPGVCLAHGNERFRREPALQRELLSDTSDAAATYADTGAANTDTSDSDANYADTCAANTDTSDSDANTYGYADRSTYGYANRNAHRDGYRHTDYDADRNANLDSYWHTYGHTDYDADRDSHRRLVAR